MQTLRLSKPTHGWCAISFDERQLPGVSYINPHLLEDLATFAEDIQAGIPSTTIRIDREERGMLYVTATNDDLLLVCGDDDTIIIDIDPDWPQMLTSLADSIERNETDWAYWASADEYEELRQNRQTVRKAIERIRACAKPVTTVPSEMFAAIAQTPISSLTKADGETLVAEMELMLAKTRQTARTVVQRGWRISEKDIAASDDGRLRHVVIKVSGEYFDDRQLAFVRTTDDTIELAGWTDSKNAKPIRDAFLRWCIDVREAHQGDSD